MAYKQAPDTHIYMEVRCLFAPQWFFPRWLYRSFTYRGEMHITVRISLGCCFVENTFIEYSNRVFSFCRCSIQAIAGLHHLRLAGFINIGSFSTNSSDSSDAGGNDAASGMAVGLFIYPPWFVSHEPTSLK